MEFVCIRSFDNYISAHIALGCLEEASINGWLKDENTVTIDPILTNAIGGIKLMIPEVQAGRALEILRVLENEHKKTMPCQQCGSLNIEMITSPRKVTTWASALIGFLFMNFAMPVEKIIHCFDCGHEFDPSQKQ